VYRSSCLRGACIADMSYCGLSEKKKKKKKKMMMMMSKEARVKAWILGVVNVVFSFVAITVTIWNELGKGVTEAFIMMATVLL